MLLIKQNYTSGNSFCWPCCCNLSLSLKMARWELNMSECHGIHKVVLMINVCVNQFLCEIVILVHRPEQDKVYW